MSKLGSFLAKKGVISAEQWKESAGVAKKNGSKTEEALVELGYASAEQVAQAMADLNGFIFINLQDVPIPPAVVELVPESVARENVVIPIEEGDDESLKVCVSDPDDFETIEKLQFILNKKIDIAIATKEHILEAINRNYGQMGD